MRTLSLSLCLLLLALPAHAEIYRWVDEQGRVHFGERPVQGAERLELRPQVIERDERVRESEDNLRRIMDVRSQERAAEQARQQQQRARQQAQCEQLQRELARFDQRTFWYEENADGRRVEVDRTRIEARKAALQTQLQERC